MSFKVLDACCGGRMIWVQKQYPDAVFIDIRKEAKGFFEYRPNFEVAPDILMDFRFLGFRNGTFDLIVWDPPHLKRLRETSWVRTKYGCLHKETWPWDLGKGFKELWRVLRPCGTLIFKWSCEEISVPDILKCFPEKPLFGHTTSKKNNTIWFTFHKRPDLNNDC